MGQAPEKVASENLSTAPRLPEVILKPLGYEEESAGWSGAQGYLTDERFFAALATFDPGQVQPRQVPRAGERTHGRAGREVVWALVGSALQNPG